MMHRSTDDTRVREGKSRGQVLILFAVMMTALLGITSIAIDTGRVWMNRRALQNAVDAAVLAGAWSLPNDTGGATTVACDYGTVKNYVTGMLGANCTAKADVIISDATFGAITVPNGKITVKTRMEMPLTLGRLFYAEPITIEARASVAIGSLHTICVFPIFQTQDLLEAAGAWDPDGADNINYGVPVIMKTSTDDASSGNFLALQVDGSSSKAAWRDTVGSPDGCSGETSETATTSTGNFVGAFDQGMKARSDLWNDPSQPGYCPDLTPTIVDGQAIHPQRDGIQATPDNCYRLVQVPLLEGSSTDYNGTTEAKIMGFLTFYISNWCGQLSTPKKGSGSDPQHCAAPGNGLPELKYGELWGYYLRFDAVTENPIVAYDGLGTKVVVLVD